MTEPIRSWPMLIVLVLILAATVGRIAAALRPGLWADEIFSLAMATGHSLEHPAADANPSLGDFVEPRDPQSPAFFRRYAEHENPPVGIRRVVRAVLLSDTNPPFYYLLLNGWTRGFGTSDSALRLFSVWWAVLALPLLWLLGRELGPSRVAWSACLLFSFSPIAIFYSAEGRMYSLLWCLALALTWSSLKLSAGGGRPWVAPLWVLAGVAGLLTHYFFAFVWLACLAWLWLGGYMPRRRLAVFAALTVLAVLPWYLEVPASLARWRISAGWLDGELAWPRALGRPLALAGSLLSGSSLLGGWRRADRLILLLFLLLAIWIAQQRSIHRLFTRPSVLVWGWLAAACLGPLLFDLLRHTTTTEIPRYVVPGLPAAMLLAALGMSQLPLKLHLPFLSAVLLAWLPGSRAVAVASVPRPWQPYREVNARLESWVHPDDLVLVTSIPPGVIGMARYSRDDIRLASWVAQLGLREVPVDLERLLSGHRRAAFVKIHHLGGSAAPEAWLRAHARLLGREVFPLSSAEVLYLGPSEGDSFFPGTSPIVRQSPAEPKLAPSGPDDPR